jgi:hypothetical protein
MDTDGRGFGGGEFKIGDLRFQREVLRELREWGTEGQRKLIGKAGTRRFDHEWTRINMKLDPEAEGYRDKADTMKYEYLGSFPYGLASKRRHPMF